jgi:hypothetical protein
MKTYSLDSAIGTYSIDSHLHESIKLNPGTVRHLRVSLVCTAYRNVVTVVRVKVNSMKSLHEKITNLRSLYQKEWGVPPDEVIVSRG